MPAQLLAHGHEAHGLGVGLIQGRAAESQHPARQPDQFPGFLSQLGLTANNQLYSSVNLFGLFLPYIRNLSPTTQLLYV